MSDNHLLTTINLGRDAQSFIDSQLGKHFLDKMDIRERAAELGMRRVNPCNVEEIRAMQNTLLVIDECRKFFYETIEAGFVSTTEYENDVEINQHDEYVES